MEFHEIKQIEKNFSDHNYSYFINTKIEFAHILYTNPLGVFSDTPDKKVDIESRLVDEIDKDEFRSWVVFGDAGSGKTSLALHLCNEYWKKVSDKSEDEISKVHYIPIYISLRQIEILKDCKNILATFCDNSPGTIKSANLFNWNLLLFLDGYDELEEKINLWDHNNWWLPDRVKKIKTVTFCKTIGLKVTEREQCFTFGDNEKSKFISVQAFETLQIEDYVRKTVTFLRSISTDDKENKNDPWMMTKKITGIRTVWENDTSEYDKWLTKMFPDLKKLSGNPYLLTIILQILPGIVEDCKQSANSSNASEQERAIRIRCSTEVGIYDEFVVQWFKYQATKNRKNKSNPDFICIPLDHLAGFMTAYAQNLAFTLIQNNRGFLGDVSVSEADSNLWHLWKPIHNKELLDLVDTNDNYAKIFPKDKDDDDNSRIRNLQSLRNSCFLSNPKVGTFKFFHSSLVEYLASREVFENVRGRFNFYLNSDDPIYDNEFGINSTDLVDVVFYPLLKDLAQRAQTNESFKNLLFEIISKSREILMLSQMSANSVTILNFAGISLSGRDFRNVQIANSNLSGANAANSDFQFANISGANLQQSWMVGCKFQGANLDKVDFGQNCSVELDEDYIIGIVPYMQNGVYNLVISYVSEKDIHDNYKYNYIYNYNYDSEVLCEIKRQTVGRRHRMYIEGNLLLNHKLSDDQVGLTSLDLDLYKFVSFETSLTAMVWDLELNEQMEPILVNNPRPIPDPAKYWITKELLKISKDTKSLEVVDLTGERSHSEPSTSSDSIKVESRSRVNDYHEDAVSVEEVFVNKIGNFYYYEIQSCQKAGVGLVLLWGYVFNKEDIIEYREPQILETFKILAKEEDKNLFRFYSDFPILVCDIYANKLVALKGQNFVIIFSIFPTYNVIFQDNFQMDLQDCGYDCIKFSSNGRYLIYQSDYVNLCIINEVKVESVKKMLEVERYGTKCFVVFDESCEMTAFSYDETIFICKLPTGTIIRKIYDKNRLFLCLFATFAFVDVTTTSNHIKKLFSYVSSNYNRTLLETIVISEAIDTISRREVKELGKFCVSNDNSRVATLYTIYNNYDETETNILSVFNTPIIPQSLLFRKRIQSPIIEVLFTPNYLLVRNFSEVLVMDMLGNFLPSINLDPDLRTAFFNSKYQKLVLCCLGHGNETLQLYSIVERVNDNSGLCPVVFEVSGNNFNNETILCLTFDSKDGSHILLYTNSRSYPPTDDSVYECLWLWVPSKNWSVKISASDVPRDKFRKFNAFYMINERNDEICVSTGLGYFFVKVSSVKSPKYKLCVDHHIFADNIMSRFYLNVDWYVYGNVYGKFYIHYLKNNVCLAEFIFPHEVEDFNLYFKYNSFNDILESVSILTWDWKGNISSLIIDGMNLNVSDASKRDNFLNWKLNWTVNSNFILNFQNSIIAKSYKVNENNKRLLNNLNVNLELGAPWPEKVEYFSLSELYMPITETETKFAIMNTKCSGGPRMPIMQDMWVVSAVARNLNSNKNTVHIEHVGLLIEGINNGRHFAMEAELTANKKKGYVRIKLFPVSNRGRLVQLENDYIARQWMRPKSDVQRLIHIIQNDQIDSREYNLLRNNCATWCLEKLKEIGIKKDRKKWYRKLFVVDLPTDLFSIRDRIVKNRLPFIPSK